MRVSGLTRLMGSCVTEGFEWLEGGYGGIVLVFWGYGLGMYCERLQMRDVMEL